MRNSHHGDGFDLAVIIPTYNSAPWLPSTLENLQRALLKSGLRPQIIVVDDGSSDDTVEVMSEIEKHYSRPIRYVRQENLGRYRARLRGLELATADVVLFLDSRVLIDESSLKEVVGDMHEIAQGTVAVNGHVRLPEDSPMVGRFWEVPTHIFWSDYLGHPRKYKLTPSNFDRAPKGLGLFLAPRSELLSAFSSVGDGEQLELISDDTRILRSLVQGTSIWLFPKFSGTYRPRVTFRGFMKHSFDRGTLFVDSYAGTSALRTLALFIAVFFPMVGLLLLVFFWVGVHVVGMAVLLALAFLFPVAVAIVGLTRSAPWRSALAFVTYFYPFSVVFWAGLVRGLILHRQHFLRRPQSQGEKS